MNNVYKLRTTEFIGKVNIYTYIEDRNWIKYGPLL